LCDVHGRLDFKILVVHFVDVLCNLLDSPFEAFVHFLQASRRFYFVGLPGGELVVGELVFDLLAFGAEVVELVVEGVSLGEEFLDFDDFVVHDVEGLLEAEDGVLEGFGVELLLVVGVDDFLLGAGAIIDVDGEEAV
jgi:hypothetical protein